MGYNIIGKEAGQKVHAITYQAGKAVHSEMNRYVPEKMVAKGITKRFIMQELNDIRKKSKIVSKLAL